MTMVNIFQRRIDVWNETKELSKMFEIPITTKYTFSDDIKSISKKYSSTKTLVVNDDSIKLGIQLKKNGFNPLVLIYADHRFAGGDVSHGSGAQEESLFRRTNLCKGLLQDKMYPILANESIIVQNITVFRDSEKNDYKILENPILLDFIACPGIQNPRLTEEGLFNSEDEQTLRIKIRCILQSAQIFGYNSLILGPLGCGAWRCPPNQVATIFKEEINLYDGVFSVIIFACLEVKENDYIVVNRGRISNYATFSEILNQ